MKSLNFLRRLSSAKHVRYLACTSRLEGHKRAVASGATASVLLLLAGGTALCETAPSEESRAHYDNSNQLSTATFAWGDTFGRKPRLVKALKKRLVEVALGDENDICIDEDGQCFVRLATPGSTSKSGGKWEQVVLPVSGFSLWSSSASKAVTCACGPGGTMYLSTDTGALLEVTKTEDGTFSTKPATTPEKVDKIFGCANRLAFVGKETGTVFIKGANDKGQLGLGFKSPEVTDWTEIEAKFFDSKVKKIAMGLEHTIFLTEGGVLFTCGLNDNKQLGLGWSKFKAKESKVRWRSLGEAGYLETIRKIGDIICEERDYKQETVMAGAVGSSESRPRAILGWLFDQGVVEDVAAGDRHGACILRIDATNEAHGVDNIHVLCWGCGLEGQLGFAQVGMSAPKRVTYVETLREFDQKTGRNRYLRPSKVACGAEHTLLLLHGYTEASKSLVFSWGYNKQGQVDLAKSVKVTKPVWVERLSTQPVESIFAHKNKSMVSW